VEELLSRIEALKIVPIITLDDADKAEPTAQAILAGGLPCAEVTFRTGAAAEAIRRISALGGMLVGAGTVLKPEQAEQAAEAGAQFLVTPGFSPKVVRFSVDNKIPIFPGVSTPTDIEAALDFGLNVVKYFPAEAFGGLKTLKAISAPYRMVRFIPTGGINQGNLRSYLELSCVIACGGSWLAKSKLISGDNFGEITRLAREAVELAKRVGG